MAPPSLRIAFALVLLTATISLCYGLQYRIGPGQVFSYYLGFSAVFAVILAFATYSLLRLASAPVRLGAIHGWCGFALMSASFTLTLYFQSKLTTPVPWYVLSVAAALIGGCLHWRWSARASTRFFALVAIAFVALSIARTEIWQKGDMLTTIEFAGKEVLAGKQPYRPYPEVYLSLGKATGIRGPGSHRLRESIPGRPPAVLLSARHLACVSPGRCAWDRPQSRQPLVSRMPHPDLRKIPAYPPRSIHRPVAHFLSAAAIAVIPGHSARDPRTALLAAPAVDDAVHSTEDGTGRPRFASDWRWPRDNRRSFSQFRCLPGFPYSSSGPTSCGTDWRHWASISR